MAGMYKTIASFILWPLWLVYFVFVMPLFYLYMTFTPQKYYHYFTRPMCWLFCLSGGQLLRLKGELPPINKGPYIYMINHGSLFDLFVIGFYIKHSKNTAVSIVPIGIIGAFEAKKKNDWRLKPGIITTCFGEVIT